MNTPVVVDTLDKLDTVDILDTLDVLDTLDTHCVGFGVGLSWF